MYSAIMFYGVPVITHTMNDAIHIESVKVVKTAGFPNVHVVRLWCAEEKAAEAEGRLRIAMANDTVFLDATDGPENAYVIADIEHHRSGPDTGELILAVETADGPNIRHELEITYWSGKE